MTLPLFDIPASTKAPPETIARAARLSDCGRYRWTLSRTWGDLPRVCFIGLNPSTADYTKDDPTVRRWIQFANAWAYGGFVAVNLYPFRSSSVADCKAWAERHDTDAGFEVRDRIQENAAIVARQARRDDVDLVVACWGAAAWDDDLVEHVIGEIQLRLGPWPDLYCLGTTKDGAPKHPMARGVHRVPDDQQPILWRKA